MYKKMLFIFISMLPVLDNYQKSLIILLLSGIVFIVSIKHQPFDRHELNKMQEKSNSAAFITVFAGCLYVISVPDILKAIAFAIILITNLRFLLLWFTTVLNLYAKAYAPRLFIMCPRLMRIFQKISSRVNTIFTFRSIRKAYHTYFHREKINIS